MILQLPSGKIIECSLEQYLLLTDEELDEIYREDSYGYENHDPFHKSFVNNHKSVSEEKLKFDDEFYTSDE